MRLGVVLLALALLGTVVLVAPAEEASATPWNPCEGAQPEFLEPCLQYIIGCAVRRICY